MLIDLRLGDCLIELKKLPDCSVQMCVTSPPYYGLRDYGIDGQIGLEETPETYVQKLVGVFGEVKRVLKDDGTLWLNLGDSYASNGCYIKSWSERHPEKQHLHTQNRERYGEDKKGFRGGEFNIKAKDLLGIPWRVAFALQADGWYLRQDIIWHKPNPMPESVTDRCTKAHEYIFLLAKNKKYYFNNEAIKEKVGEAVRRPTEFRGGNIYNAFNNSNPHLRKTKYKEEKPIYTGRNKRSVWTVTTKPFKEAHFATFPEDLIKPCILAGSRIGDTILDPFFGAGTTGVVAKKLGRNCIGIELNPEYIKMAQRRIDNTMEDMFVHPPKKE
jgi:DNA modification methylase